MGFRRTTIWMRCHLHGSRSFTWQDTPTLARIFSTTMARLFQKWSGSYMHARDGASGPAPRWWSGTRMCRRCTDSNRSANKRAMWSDVRLAELQRAFFAAVRARGAPPAGLEALFTASARQTATERL